MAPSFFSKLTLAKDTPNSRTPSPGPGTNRSGSSSTGRQTPAPIDQDQIPPSAVPKHVHAARDSMRSIEIGIVPPTPKDSLAESYSPAGDGDDVRPFSSSAPAKASRTSLQSRRRGDSRSITSQEELNMPIARSHSPSGVIPQDDLITPMPRSRVDLTRSPANKSTRSLTPESSQSNLRSRPPSIHLTEDNFTGEIKRSSSKSSSIFRRRSKVNSPNGEPQHERMPPLNPALMNGGNPPDSATDMATPTNGTDNGPATGGIGSPRMGPRTAIPDGYSPATPSNQRGWRKTSNKKPQGLAAAIAQSGISMANPYASAVSLQPTMSPVASPKPAAATPNLGRTTPSSSSRHRAASSVGSLPGGKQASLVSSEGVDSDGIYDSDKSQTDGSASDDDDMDFLSESMPVTGFAVASSKRNADFHELFKSVPEGDYLIEDYGCALQREILIQGRIYISENHICFHANIFGWITDLQIPFHEIVALEKKMTAFVIPNALQIDTRQAKYNFTSFLSRDTTYDVMYNIWRTARPSDSGSVISGAPSQQSGEKGQIAAPKQASNMNNKVTQCLCSKENKHFSENALETIIPGTPEKIYNLIFASAWIKNFLVGNQKLMDLQISDWAPTPEDSKLLFRQMSYIKPLNGSIGPKSTKCELRDETIHCDFDDYVVMLTTTRTPDVPSGGAFSVKTRTCLSWASPASTKITVTTQVEWTGRSFIKGIIESSAIQGQKQYHQDLENAMREEIKQNASEYVPEGMEVSVDEAPAQTPSSALPPMTPGTKAAHDEAVQREKERNARGLQWAYETFEGAYKVGKKSATGAIDLIKETWEASSSTTILIFIVVGLVLSNVYTLTMVNSSSASRADRIKLQEREQWVHGVVTALWEELAQGKGLTQITSEDIKGVPNWRNELAQIDKTLTGLEERIKTVRSSLNEII